MRTVFQVLQILNGLQFSPRKVKESEVFDRAFERKEKLFDGVESFLFRPVVSDIDADSWLKGFRVAEVDGGRIKGPIVIEQVFT